MFSRCPSIILLAILYACLLLNHQTVLSFTPSTISSARHHLQSTITQRYLFNIQSGSAKIPTSNTDRNSAAISSIKSAISKPRIPTCPLIECEFPPLQQINKLGDGSLRSAMQVEDANIQFVQKLIGGIATPLFGPNVNLILSSSASNALVKKVEKKVKGTKIYSLKEGLPEVNGKDEVCVFLTPSSQKDYQVARMLAENGVSTVLVNGSFKVMKCCYMCQCCNMCQVKSEMNTHILCTTTFHIAKIIETLWGITCFRIKRAYHQMQQWATLLNH